ncbi:MAG: tRNA (adenosine(37)-N6)-threonylcarbamoyltransferase complex ATPase subunit type 1 TsaE [Gammaproteobacteria bacterium RIFCSPHIGHO2_12_FULL_63_22]|nr:MAG: tRNA (adenosine(37)-N6)-threonylcarbamoyltransferase complex ATPase subunit type 1 TsaE [Gammaproteobacteria bacterium RIFCSPHIGHO2_12_FULL_63_22]
MTRVTTLADAAATDRLGQQLASAMPESAVVFLRGDLGAGKTSLARALLRGLGVQGPIKSPTYTLIERYPLAAGEAVHLDLYRIAEASELEFLGLQDLMPEVRLWLVEWPDHGLGALPPPDLEITLSVAGQGREIRLDATSPAGNRWLASLSELGHLGSAS